MKKPLIILNIAAATLLVPIALSFANTQPPAPALQTEAGAAKATINHNAVTSLLPSESKPDCKPAVRVAYAGYGEAQRVCAVQADKRTVSHQ